MEKWGVSRVVEEWVGALYFYFPFYTTIIYISSQDRLPPSTTRSLPHVFDRVLDKDKMEAALKRGIDDTDTMAHLSVKMYFTKEYEAVTTDVQGQIENMIAVMNQGFLNTNIKITVHLHCIERYIAPEPAEGGMGQLFEEFEAYKVQTKPNRHQFQS